MDDLENLAGIYHEKLNNTEEKAGKILAQFYWALFEKQFDTKDLIMFRKLVRVYGKETVFSAILDIYSMDNITGRPDKLLYYFCKKIFQTSSPAIDYFNSNDISKRLAQAQKRGKSIVQSRE